MRALVTGGAGFIGSHLVDRLLAAGHAVTAVDDLSTGREANLEQALEGGAELIRADVASDPLDSIFVEARPDVVFHLAAQINVRRALEDPVFDARLNVLGTVAVLEAARNAGARRVLFASSGGAGYGDPEQIPTPEEAPLRPLSPYGASKVAGEVYLGLARDLHSLSTLSLRLANVYGPRQDAKGEAGVVAIFCEAVAAGGRARIFGDGGQSRDFVYVGDVVDAFARAGESDATGAVNVGTGKGTTVRELAAALELEADLDEPIPGEVRHSRLDVTRAEHMLGWRPSTPLAEGLERTLAWTRRPAQAS